MGHGGWVLVRAVWQGLVGIGSVVRQGWVGARRLSRVVTRLRQADAAQPSEVLQPEAYEHTAPGSTFPAAPPPVSREEETAVDSSVRSARQRHAPLERLLARIIATTSSVRSARQGHLPPVQSSEAARRKRQPVAATPASRIVPPGTGTSYSVSVTPSNGFTGNVTFGVTGLPSGATASFSPSSVTGSGSSTLSVNTSSSTPTGSYTLTITATNGSNLTHSTQVTLVVADFSVLAAPSSRTVSRNAKTTYTVTVTALGPFSATVTFSVSGLPARTSASFSPTSVAGAGNTTLTVSSKPKAAIGTYPLTITATGGGVTHSTTVNLVIQ